MKDTVTLVEIAKKAHIDPSSARTKVRRLYADPAVKKTLPKPIERWAYRRKDVPAVKKMLTN